MYQEINKLIKTNIMETKIMKTKKEAPRSQWAISMKINWEEVYEAEGLEELDADVDPSDLVLSMMENNQTPVDFHDRIAKKLKVSNGKPTFTGFENEFYIDGKTYLILKENTARILVKMIIRRIIDERFAHLIPVECQPYFDEMEMAYDWMSFGSWSKWVEPKYDKGFNEEVEYFGVRFLFFQVG